MGVLVCILDAFIKSSLLTIFGCSILSCGKHWVIQEQKIDKKYYVTNLSRSSLEKLLTSVN